MNVYQKALEEEQAGNWNLAHELVQDLPDSKAAWVHAYLHRKEGDDFNAGYWYRRAQRDFPKVSLHREWEELYTALSDQ